MIRPCNTFQRIKPHFFTIRYRTTTVPFKMARSATVVQVGIKFSLVGSFISLATIIFLVIWFYEYFNFVKLVNITLRSYGCEILFTVNTNTTVFWETAP
jgi:hypothetical protein